MRRLAVKAELRDGAEAGGHAAPADHLDEGIIVAGAAGVVIPSFEDAIINQHAEKRGRHLVGVHPSDEPTAAHLDFDEMPQLGSESSEQLLEALERLRATGPQSQLFACPRIESVVQD